MWYAIRTAPGAQLPQREYAVESTSLGKDGRPRGKGYRIVPSLNPRVSAIERDLTEIGVSHYMPAEFKVRRVRDKTNTYQLRRFPLLPGYVFVADVTDWLTLMELPGVVGFLSVDGRPLVVGIADIMTLRGIEAKSEATADRDIQKMANKEASESRKAAAAGLRAAKRRISQGARVRVLWGRQTGREATVQEWQDDGSIKALVHRLDAVESISLPYDAVRLVA